ncbi:hypothetical protein AbraIFM66950_005237 [Aspergillus brasiliensis]|nr:hypothetical protein AbraIFM66950_005237 [Aspergillus brasiliensis]
MRLQLTSLALLATASTVVADDVISALWPSASSGESYNAKLIGTTGGDLTTLVINCPATASGSVTSAPAATAATTSAAVVKRATTASSSGDDDDDDIDGCNIPDSGQTLTVGSSTWAFTTSGTAFSEEAACTFTGTTVASCALTFNIDSQTSSSSGVTTTQLGKVPITITSTVSASATGSATGGSTTASATGGASGSGSGSSASSTGAATTTSDSGAFATSASQWVAGGAAMMVALAMA